MMHDSFDQRIPKLLNEDLLRYVEEFRRFRPEAVAIALDELEKRNIPVSKETRSVLQEYIVGSSTVQDQPKGNRSKMYDWLSLGCLSIGITGFFVLRFWIPEDSDLSSDFNPLDTKKYIRQLEVIGGKANLLSIEFTEWFKSLWHGQNLATTFLVSFCILGVIFFSMSRITALKNKF